jgi:hypothetical protein
MNTLKLGKEYLARGWRLSTTYENIYLYTPDSRCALFTVMTDDVKNIEHFIDAWETLEALKRAIKNG